MLTSAVITFCIKSVPYLLKAPYFQNTVKCTASVFTERKFYQNKNLKEGAIYNTLLANCNEQFHQKSNTHYTKQYALLVPQKDDLPISKIAIKTPRSYTTSSSHDGSQGGPQKMRVPKLILIQNPFTWLITKFDFVVLRSLWDPTFEEKDFKIGTKQAVSRVTQLLADGRHTDLSGLLTRSAKATLLRDLEKSWPERQKKLISLTNDDIQITSPRKVYFIRVADKKFCAVDMAFLALKWASAKRTDGLVFAEIFARFHREYTAYSIPEWTIAYFKVTRFDILRKK